jgi:NADPH:quinone reductase-like Zn-dependent oxidoreductase
MKAAVRTSYGPPDVVRVLLDVDKPTIKGDEVLVRFTRRVSGGG